VAWTDARSGFDYDIYGARVTPQGTVLDPSGIAISTAAGYQWFFLAVAFDDADLLVVWTDRRSMDHYDIYGARVTPQGTVLDPEGIAISIAVGDQAYPAVAFDGTNSLVVWEDWRSGDTSDIHGARVSPAGVVFDSGPVVRQEGGQYRPKLARGTGSQLFLVYQGWAGTVGGKTYNVNRIWGKMDPSPAIAEMTKPEVRRTNNGATIVRGVLFLPGDRRPGTGDRAVLLDISGRKVAELRPGANDVRALAPGVYFIREEMNAEERDRVTKVIVQH
jgi:phosphoribosylformylglycinamidine (FGAM) synthase PurS component